MTKRRVVLIAAVLALLTGTVAALLLVPRPSPFERAYYRLHVGMTKEEVTAVMGRPSKEQLGDNLYHFVLPDEAVLHEANDPQWTQRRHFTEHHFWEQDGYHVWVRFDTVDRVGWTSKVSSTQLIGPAPSPIFERLRAWLGL